MINVLSKARWKYAPFVYIAVLVVWVIYAGLTLANAHTGSNTYHIPTGSVYLLDTTILIPVLVVWLLAARGAIHLISYALLIKDAPEGRGLLNLAQGVKLLLVYLILIAVLGAVLPFIHTPSHLKIAIVVKNQLPALIALAAFIYLYLGSLKLSRTSEARPPSKILSTVGFLIAAALFAWAFWISPTDTLQQTNGIPVYIIPHNLLLFSLVLPYLCAWLLGLHATINISSYAKSVKGQLYKGALGNISKGIMASVIFTVILQLFTVGTPIFNNFNLESFLVVIYFIIILYGLGAYYISVGSRKLTLIEVAG